MATRNFRGVVVYRPTDYELLLATHATRGQAEFFLKSRGQSFDEVERDHATIQQAISAVLSAMPPRWRRTSISRSELNRFLFEPEDIIVAVGQDGLVANVAKYLTGQPVLGINPLPERFEGALVRYPVAAARDLIADIDAQRIPPTQSRTMVEARLDDGQSLTALNEVFLGHRSHQSARYRISMDQKTECHSSSGLICCTGTGASGWASSIQRATQSPLPLPAPTDSSLTFFVREAWLSKKTQAGLVSGSLTPAHPLHVISEMNQGGVIFGDGIEDDYLSFDWGRTATIGIAAQQLQLVG